MATGRLTLSGKRMFSHAISVVDELGHDSLNLLIIAHAHVYWSRHAPGTLYIFTILLLKPFQPGLCDTHRFSLSSIVQFLQASTK